MKFNYKAFGMVAAASALLSLQACSGSGSENKNQNQGQEESGFAQVEEPTTFYLLPSPEDIFAFSAEKLKFSSQLLNPSENAGNYQDSKSQEVNFGVYCADMAYCAVNGQYQDAAKYLKTLKELSSKLGLEAVFNQKLSSRVDQHIEDKDSLKAIANDTYIDIKKALESQGKNATIAQISAGGWLECMYIITNSIESFSDTDLNIQQIADEKNVFESLMAYLGQYKSRPGIEETINQLKPLEEAYNKLSVVFTEQTSNTTTSDGAIVIGDGKKIEISEENFNLLKKRMAEIRTALITNK
ncbi:MAG: hypothetical protein II937_14775 [Bacteroidales bacterium]|nr:hypothetical protein [Bacteroidales bacterium]